MSPRDQIYILPRSDGQSGVPAERGPEGQYEMTCLAISNGQSGPICINCETVRGLIHIADMYNFDRYLGAWGRTNGTQNQKLSTDMNFGLDGQLSIKF